MVFKRVSRGLVLAVILLVIAMPVLAGYYAALTVTEANGTDYTELALQVSADIDLLETEGYITSGGLDTRVEYSATDLPHMLVDDRIMFVTDVVGSGTANLQFTTGDTALSSFPIVVGDGGYVTISDHANLELGDDFEVAFDGYVDTSMTDPTVVDSATSTEDTQETSHTVTLPGSIEAGNLLILLFGIPDDPAITSPAGWTELDNYSSAGGNVAGVVLYRIADGAEGATVTVTTGDVEYSAHQVLEIANYYGVPEISTRALGNGHPNSGSLSASWGAAGDTLWLPLFVARENSSQTISSAPTNYGDDELAVSALGYAYAGSSTRLYEVASENPGAYTMSGALDYYMAWTVGVRGSIPLVEKEASFSIYTDDGDIQGMLVGGSTLDVSSTQSSGEYVVNVWADTTNFGIDIDASTEDSTALGGVSAADNANDWILSPIYWDYYIHTTSSTLRITYQPDDIIAGTTLLNEENPGTYDGTITFGSNPGGITVTLGGLVSDFQPVPAGGAAELPAPQDVVGETGQPGWTEDPTGLSSHPLYSLVNTISTTTNIPLNIVWILGATFIIVAAMLVGFAYIPHHIITVLIGGGLYAFFWHQGIFPFWGVFIFAAGGLAVVLSERVQSY